MAKGGAKKKKAPPRKRRSSLLRLFFAGIMVFDLYQARTWPDVAALAKHPPRTTAFIERWREQMLREHRAAPVAWAWVPYSRISGSLKRAVLVSEDINFFSHNGFDAGAIQQALEEAWEEGEKPRGASTITQQTAKNLWLSPSRNPLRKAKEAVLTAELEYFLPKRRILELYLNIAEFGPGVFGAEAASRRYFGKPAEGLSAYEAALLAAGLPRPRQWHPGSKSALYQKKARRIQSRMERAVFLGRLIGSE